MAIDFTLAPVHGEIRSRVRDDVGGAFAVAFEGLADRAPVRRTPTAGADTRSAPSATGHPSA